MLYPEGLLFYELKKKAIVEIIVYTTQVNNAFRTRRLASSEVNST